MEAMLKLGLKVVRILPYTPELGFYERSHGILSSIFKAILEYTKGYINNEILRALLKKAVYLANIRERYGISPWSLCHSIEAKDIVFAESEDLQARMRVLLDRQQQQIEKIDDSYKATVMTRSKKLAAERKIVEGDVVARYRPPAFKGDAIFTRRFRVERLDGHRAVLKDLKDERCYIESLGNLRKIIL